MGLFLDILQGASAGERFPLLEGYRVGRTEGEVRLRDSKISSLHAVVEKGEKGQLFLVDKDSTNGLRVDGKRLGRVALTNGLKFLIGKTLVRVVEYEREKAGPISAPADWRGLLVQQLPNAPLNDIPSIGPDTEPKPFLQPIKLRMLTGIQAKQEWVLGFGPRNFGAEGLGFELLEPTSPDIAFRIIPEENGARFETQYVDQVLLNEKPIYAELLRDGDQIRLGDSLIEVSFLK